MRHARSQCFLDFIQEREQIRLRKEADFVAKENFEDPQGPPWTDDLILREYKFTNVRRHHDRTSKFFRDTFYEDHFLDDRREILMNAALFRYFGTIEFAKVIGWQPFEFFDFEGIKEVARRRLESGDRVFTGAYVITNQGISAPKQNVVVDYFLKGLHAQVDQICRVVQMTRKWEKVSDEMRKIAGFGGSGFMTKEVLLDTTYTGFWGEENTHYIDGEGNFSFPIDWWEWTPVGPGARRGAARVAGNDSATPLGEAVARSVIMQLMNDVNESGWEHGKLSPTDIQFQLCEFDKYERVRLGQGRPRSKYKGGS